MVSKCSLKKCCSCQLHETVKESRKGHSLCGFQQIKYGTYCVCVFVWECACVCRCIHVLLTGKTGVQGMMARLLSSKLSKVSCHHQHRYYALTQTANVLQLCPWNERRSRDGQDIFYFSCLDETGLMTLTCVSYIVWKCKKPGLINYVMYVLTYEILLQKCWQNVLLICYKPLRVRQYKWKIIPARCLTV